MKSITSPRIIQSDFENDLQFELVEMLLQALILKLLFYT